MKILRIRRGFTTNSSGANEYIPSDAGPDAGEAAGESGQLASTSEPGSTSAPMGNAFVIGLMTAGVVMLFVAERVVQYFWGKRRKSPTDDESRNTDKST
jgi:hypothetical protein